MDDPLVLLVALILVVESAYSLFCVWDIRRRYPRARIDNIVWDRLAFGDTRALVAGVVMIFLILYGLLGYVFDWPPLRPWGSLLLGFAWFLLSWGPIATRRMIGRIERGE